MNFFSFPAEIRLMIYSGLLVLDGENIELLLNCHFWSDNNSVPPRLYWKDRGAGEQLHLEILRRNRTVYAQATPLLYSQNRFQFLDIPGDGRPSPLIDKFLQQIGARQARLIRHVAIDFPKFCTWGRLDPERHKLSDEFIRSLQLLWVSCPNLRTLDLHVRLGSLRDRVFPPHGRDLEEGLLSRRALDLVGDQLRATQSLSETTVVLEGYAGFPEEWNQQLQIIRDHGWKARAVPLWRSLFHDENYEDEQAFEDHNKSKNCRNWAYI